VIRAFHARALHQLAPSFGASFYRYADTLTRALVK
jgi:hypothetical protein